MKAARKPRARRTPAPSRRPAKTTRVSRGMQWPSETDAQALTAWNLAVESWNGGNAA
jgi:hypothetical protein